MFIKQTSNKFVHNTNCNDSDKNFQRIEVSDQKTLQLQFNQTFGFGIEYHRNCAFDKVHVFDQNDNSRLARFCGPKDDLPYDGARKLRAIDGELEMWDLPFD